MPVSLPTVGFLKQSQRDKLTSLLNAIPTATEGNVITVDHHNSLRTALLALVSQLDLGDGSVQAGQLTLAPLFNANAGEAPWLLRDGMALIPEAEAAQRISATGWLTLQLPDGVQLQGMRVFGLRTGNPPTGPFNKYSLQTQLLRYTLNDPAQTPLPLVTITLTTATDFTQVPGTVQVGENERTVDNDSYRYLVKAELRNAIAEMDVQLRAIQLTLG